jgi:hypothetical protein
MRCVTIHVTRHRLRHPTWIVALQPHRSAFRPSKMQYSRVATTGSLGTLAFTLVRLRATRGVCADTNLEWGPFRWRSGRRQKELGQLRSSDPGFLVLRRFTYLSIFLFAFIPCAWVEKLRVRPLRAVLDSWCRVAPKRWTRRATQVPVAALSVVRKRKLSRSTLGAITPRSARALPEKQIEAIPTNVGWGISKPAYAGMTLLQQRAMKQASGWFR